MWHTPCWSSRWICLVLEIIEQKTHTDCAQTDLIVSISTMWSMYTRFQRCTVTIIRGRVHQVFIVMRARVHTPRVLFYSNYLSIYLSVYFPYKFIRCFLLSLLCMYVFAHRINNQSKITKKNKREAISF